MELRRGVEIWKVPGHTPEDIAVIVRNVPDPGHTNLLTNVAITGDLFYTSEDAFADTPIWTQTALDPSKGKESKRKVICNVQNVIPGHGRMFAVTQQMRNFQNCVGVGHVNAVTRAEPLQMPKPKSTNENAGGPAPRPYDGGYYGP
ncbi:Protein C03F11.2 [Aphelenchoides avenae]|nr:Protein C03F11.2 [Aphelenchus avenae]